MGYSYIRFSNDAQAYRAELEKKNVALMGVDTFNTKLSARFGKYDGLFARLCAGGQGAPKHLSQAQDGPDQEGHGAHGAPPRPSLNHISHICGGGVQNNKTSLHALNWHVQGRE